MCKILYFGAEWCSACHSFLPVVDDVCREQNIQVEFLDVDECPDELISRYRIMSIPTTICVDDDGNVIWRRTGTMPRTHLEDLMRGRS